MRAAELRLVERLDLLERDVPVAVERLLKRRNVAHVIRSRTATGRGRACSGPGRPARCDRRRASRPMRTLRRLELLRGECRFAEDLAEQLEGLRERVALGFDGEGQLPRGTAAASAPATAATPSAATAAARRDADAQRIQLLAQGLAIVLLRAGHHQAGEHPGHGRLALERFGVAVVQRQHERDRLAAILLVQQPGLQAAVIDDLDPGIQVGGRGVERFARGPHGAALVILHDQVDGGCGGHGQPRRFLGRDVDADRAIGLLEIGLRHAVDVGRGHGGDPVALDEQQSPIAEARRRAQRLRHRLAVRLQHARRSACCGPSPCSPRRR